MSERILILNAFKPNSSIDDPHFFAGRKSEIRALTDSLLTEGSCPVIYGDRGIGKSSLAKQVARIALGDSGLLIAIGSSNHILSSGQSFIVYWIDCSDATKNKDELLQRIINSAEGYSNIEHFQKKVISGESVKTKISFKVFESETVKNYETASREKFAKLNIEDQFYAITDTILETENKKILIIIDELDRVADTTGLSNFLKNTSTSNIKFLLVGIANNISTLLNDHESMERKLIPVKVKRMNKEELGEIIDKTSKYLRDNHIDIFFKKEAKNYLCEIAGGFPWFIHVIGQAALICAYDGKRHIVDEEDVNNSIKDLSKNRFAQQFSDLYHQSVRDSANREIILRLLAKWDDDDVPLSEIYRIAKKLSISNPSSLKKDLMQRKFGATIIAPPGHERGMIRFKNLMYKRYVNLRTSIYQGIEEKVEKAWREDRKGST